MIKVKQVVVNKKQLEELEKLANMNLSTIEKNIELNIKKFKKNANAKIDQMQQMIDAKEDECIELNDECKTLNKVIHFNDGQIDQLSELVSDLNSKELNILSELQMANKLKDKQTAFFTFLIAFSGTLNIGLLIYYLLNQQ